MSAKDSLAWSLLKARLREKDKEELLLLLQQLYTESVENKHLIAFHCGAIDAQQAAEPYRKIIMRTFYRTRHANTGPARHARPSAISKS
ncbi:MAG: hypothetical protein IPK16_03805 [Anaerolineales bacterium]|nr:hypothetical protein [Anaerolineales bacterium]